MLTIKSLKGTIKTWKVGENRKEKKVSTLDAVALDKFNTYSIYL